MNNIYYKEILQVRGQRVYEFFPSRVKLSLLQTAVSFHHSLVLSLFRSLALAYVGPPFIGEGDFLLEQFLTPFLAAAKHFFFIFLMVIL